MDALARMVRHREPPPTLTVAGGAGRSPLSAGLAPIGRPRRGYPRADGAGPVDPAAADVRRRSGVAPRPSPQAHADVLALPALRGRRRGGRRDGETAHVYVDRPGPRVLGAIALVAVLSLCDAAFTLYELSRGATEANPIMRAALDLGNGGFVLVKTLMTVLGAAFLGLHKTWRLGRVCLVIAVVGYLALTVWHLYGIFFCSVRPSA